MKDLVSHLAGGLLPGLEQLEVVAAGQNVEQLGELPGQRGHPVLVTCTDNISKGNVSRYVDEV